MLSKISLERKIFKKDEKLFLKWLSGNGREILKEIVRVSIKSIKIIKKLNLWSLK